VPILNSLSMVESKLASLKLLLPQSSLLITSSIQPLEACNSILLKVLQKEELVSLIPL
jgi:hypothetical protein